MPKTDIDMNVSPFVTRNLVFCGSKYIDSHIKWYIYIKFDLCQFIKRIYQHLISRDSLLINNTHRHLDFYWTIPPLHFKHWQNILKSLHGRHLIGCPSSRIHTIGKWLTEVSFDRKSDIITTILSWEGCYMFLVPDVITHDGLPEITLKLCPRKHLPLMELDDAFNGGHNETNLKCELL